MSEPYIGRAAKAAARAKHNRIHKPMSTKKKTAAKRPAKKASTKQAKAFAEALATFKAPEPPPFEYPAEEEREKTFATVGPLSFEAVPYFGPPGGEELDVTFDSAEEAQGLPAPLPLTQTTQEASQSSFGHIVPQALPDAPQTALQDEKLGQTPEPEKLVHHITNDNLASVIENLIDAINFAHSKGMLRKMQEKDTQIIKARIASGRKLIAQLRA